MQLVVEPGSYLRGEKITFDITFTHMQANTHTHTYIVFEINLQNNNSFMSILSNI